MIIKVALDCISTHWLQSNNQFVKRIEIKYFIFQLNKLKNFDRSLYYFLDGSTEVIAEVEELILKQKILLRGLIQNFWEIERYKEKFNYIQRRDMLEKDTKAVTAIRLNKQ